MTVATPRALRVLVVDDHEDGAEVLAVVLRLDGHDVQVAHDGEGALERCAARPPELILLDLNLGGELDGCDVARRLRRQEGVRAACLVAVTGHGTSEHRRRASEAGFDMFLLKPIDPAELRELALTVGSA
ncbi:MAG TPA: response regulator [Vicinamibacteria bacterium]|nr:response regulator [Vicinamibacteria bacterium]